MDYSIAFFIGIMFFNGEEIVAGLIITFLVNIKLMMVIFTKKTNTDMKKEQNKSNVVVPKKPVDVLFDKYAESHQDHTNKLIHWICVPLIVFSLLGLVWTIPFPQLEVLGKFNGFLNWASFLIAFSLYYYYTLSPVLSFLMLWIISLMSYFIVQLEYWQAGGGPAVWLVCLVIFVASWIGQFIGHKIEGKKPSFLDDIKFLLIGPIWLLHFICRRVGLRY